MDVENLDLSSINDENPLKLVFKMAKRLLDTGANDSEIFSAKVELFNELLNYNKVKTLDQRKALTYFLEYLFLIQDDSLSKKFKEFKENTGGGNMGIDEIREKYLKEEGMLQKEMEIAKNLLDLLDDETISAKTGLDINIVKNLRLENIN